MNIREIIIAEAIFHDGDYDKIYRDLSSHKTFSLEEAHEICKSLKCQALTILDRDYPEYLRHMFKPPFVIFYYGDISLLNEPSSALGVVGTRDPSTQKEQLTYELVSKLCKDYIIVSGLAKGIDRAAHKAAIENGGRTVAILGSGIDLCYPTENLDLYEEIKNSGKHLIISEYPNLSTPDMKHFPFRNRLIAMFSKGILVTESAKRSGTSITVNYGLLFGRDIMCVPSNDLNNSGCNFYIKQGAALVENADDVLTIMSTLRLV